MFSVDYNNVREQNTPIELVKSVRMAWFKVLLSQVKSLYMTFVQYRTNALYKLSFNGQIVYLKHVLNDTFDPANRAIYIDNVADVNYIYLYNKSELRPPFYFYNNYNSGTAYAIGEFAVYQNKVWKCITPSTGNTPVEGTYWTFHTDIVYFKNLSEYASLYDFIVMVPASLVFDTNKMKALVNYYKVAGKRYTIQTY